MRHLGTQVLETTHLILRPFDYKDYEAMYKNWGTDPEVTKYLRWKPYEALEQAQEVVQSWVSRYEQNDFYHWAIELKETGQLVGTINVADYDTQTERATVSYCIGRHWWNQGIASESLSRIIRYLLEDVGMCKVEAWHDSRNAASGAVMRKCGMVFRGERHQAGWNNQGICDVCLYTISPAD